MLQFASIFDRLFTFGINQHDSPDSLGEGYVEDAINVDVEGTSLIRRKGYDVFGGDVPLRIETTVLTPYAGNTKNKGEFTLPAYVNLTNVTPGPIEIDLRYFKSGATTASTFTGRFTEDEWVLGDRLSLPAVSTSQTFAPESTGVSTINSLIGFQDTTTVSEFYPDSLSIDTASLNMTVGYVTADDIDCYVSVYNTTAGVDSYRNDDVVSGGFGTVASYTIPVATHGLPNLNIIPRQYVKSGTVYSEIFPESVSINAVGDVTVTNDGLVIGADKLAVLLVSAGATSIVEGTTTSITSTSVNIPDATTKHLIAACYTTVDGVNYTHVYPSTVDYVSPLSLSNPDSHNVVFEHGTAGLNYRIIFVYATTSINKIIVDDIGSVQVTGSAQTITKMLSVVRGIPQIALPVKTFINYIDAYVADDETIIGCDGILFRSASDAVVETFDARARAASTQVIGPVFMPSGMLLTRTLGQVVTSSATSAGYVPVTAASYNAGTTYTDYIITAVGHGGAAATSISTSRDWLTVTGVNNYRFNGTYEIKSVSTVDANTIVISVDNGNVNKAIWDVSGIRGNAGVFTDQIISTTAIVAPVDSTINLSSTVSVAALSTVTTTIPNDTLHIAGITELFSIVSGRRFGYTVDSSDTLSLNTAMLYAGAAVNVSSVSATGVVGTPTYTTVISAHDDEVIFRDAVPVIDGRCVINAPTYWDVIYPADDKLGNDFIDRSEIIRSMPGRGSMYLSNGLKYDGDKIYRTGLPSLQSQLFVTIDDTETGKIPFTGLNVQVKIPIVTAVDFAGADTLTSVAHGFTNGMPVTIATTTNDPPAPLAEGTTYYVIYVGVDTFKLEASIGGGAINLTDAGTGTITMGFTSANLLMVTSASAMASLDKVLIYTDGTDNTVSPNAIAEIDSITTTAGVSTVQLTLPLTVPATGTSYLSRYVEYSYYARLSLIDRKGNQIVGPSTGIGDLRVRLASAAAVKIRGVVLPEGVENIDYDRLTVEIFRRNNTAALAGSVSAKYYKVGQVPVSTLTWYFDFVDSRSDNTISTADVDPIIDTLAGGIGETRSAPYAGKHITAINNQLVYSNLTTDPMIRLSTLGDVSEAAYQGKTVTVTTYDSEYVTSSTSRAFKTIATPADITAITETVHAVNGKFVVNVDLAYNAANFVPGQWVYIARNTPNSISSGSRYLGWWQVTSDADDGGGKTALTINWVGVTADIASDTSDVVIYYIAGDATTIPLSGQLIHYNMGASVAYNGDTNPRTQFMYHLASAINVVYARLSAASGVSTIYARGGRDLTSGYISICGQRLKSIDLSAFLITGVTIYNSGSVLIAPYVITSAAGEYGARSIMSIPRFPEVFTDIDADSSLNLPGVQDANPEDGEDITAAIPFFADSAFGAALRTNVLVVFKPHSIYIMDPQAKIAGTSDFFKRIESRGLGCEAPGSITSSADGVFFVSRAGVHMIDKSFNMINTGHKIERFWEHDLVDRDMLSRMCCSNYPTGRQYRVSYTAKSDDTNYSSGVLSFKFGEDEMQGILPGAWTRYDNMFPTCFSNRGGDIYFASDKGYIGRMASSGEDTDYSDMGAAIKCDVTFRAFSGDAPFNRKLVKFITFYLESRLDAPTNNIRVYSANDFSNSFDEMDNYTLSGSAMVDLNSLGDPETDKVARAAFSPLRPHITYIQVRITAETNRADFGINKLVYTTALLRTRGVQQAAQSTK